MIFGFSEDMLKKLGATFTATEIRQQPKLWRETYNIVKQNKNKIEEFLNTLEIVKEKDFRL